MKRFHKINDGFICEVCKAENPPAEKTCRNHCFKCLHSKHVDINPGDRANVCKATLKPIGLEVKGGLPSAIKFKCTKCSFEGRNKIALDDDREAIFALIEKN